MRQFRSPNIPIFFADVTGLMLAFCKDCPVKLVVFDFDETLTLATFMTGNCEYADDEATRMYLVLGCCGQVGEMPVGAENRETR